MNALRIQFWSPKHALRFKGGGSNPAAAAVAAAPTPTPAPPVTSDSPAVIAAEQDEAKENLIKKSVKKTILAGDTGGYMPGPQDKAPAANVGYKGNLG